MASRAAIVIAAKRKSLRAWRDYLVYKSRYGWDLDDAVDELAALLGHSRSLSVFSGGIPISQTPLDALFGDIKPSRVTNLIPRTKREARESRRICKAISRGNKKAIREMRET